MSGRTERVAKGRRFRFLPIEWIPTPSLLCELSRPVTEADDDLPIQYAIGIDTAYEALSVLLNGYHKRGAEVGENDVVHTLLYFESSGGYASCKPHHLIRVIFEDGAVSPVPPPHLQNMIHESEIKDFADVYTVPGYLRVPASFWQTRSLTALIDPTYASGFLLESPFNRRVSGKEGAALWLHQRLEGVK